MQNKYVPIHRLTTMLQIKIFGLQNLTFDLCTIIQAKKTKVARFNEMDMCHPVSILYIYTTHTLYK